MSSLERLKETLREEAAVEIAAIQAENEKKLAAIQAAAQAKAEAAAAEILASVDEDIEEGNRKAEAEAALVRRRIVLAAKAALIDEVMKKASTMLTELPEERYRSFLVKQLEEAVPRQGEVQVVLNEKDRSSFGEALLREVEAAVKAKGYECRLHLATEVGAMSGGFRLIGPDYVIDSSFERVLATVGELYEPDMARILFADNE